MFSVPSLPGKNLGNVCENSREGENPHLLSNSPKCLRRFLTGYEGTENTSYFLNLICYGKVNIEAGIFS